jgi:hypothetical protein
VSGIKLKLRNTKMFAWFKSLFKKQEQSLSTSTAAVVDVVLKAIEPKYYLHYSIDGGLSGRDRDGVNEFETLAEAEAEKSDLCKREAFYNIRITRSSVKCSD